MSHYDKKYFDWQKNIGEFAGLVNRFFFMPFMDEKKNVLDYGCGGGYLLKNLPGAEKIGYEINLSAHETIKANGITPKSSFDEIPDHWADIVISNSVLEHVHHPLTELKKLYDKVKPGGLLVFVVPHEIFMEFREDDVNQHLYTWSEMCLGNLFKLAGYKVLKVETIYYRWPIIIYPRVYKWLGEKRFVKVSKFYARYLHYWVLKFRPVYRHYGIVRYIRIVAQKNA